MTEQFFEAPVLNSPYEHSSRHWELDENNQPTNHIVEQRRAASYITPIAKPKKQVGQPQQAPLVMDEGKGLSSEDQQYDTTSTINLVRRHVDRWRHLPQEQWRVTPETARLLNHWRHHQFSSLRPFFCQVEAVETVIWLTEVAPGMGREERQILDRLAAASEQANPGLERLALKLATGAGKTTVMAMLIAWQTVNAVRRPNSRNFTRGFLVVTPGITIRDRLRVLLLDRKNRVVGLRTIYQGNGDCALVRPAEVFRPAVIEAVPQIVVWERMSRWSNVKLPSRRSADQKYFRCISSFVVRWRSAKKLSSMVSVHQ